jgi:hypothetical protein
MEVVGGRWERWRDAVCAMAANEGHGRGAASGSGEICSVLQRSQECFMIRRTRPEKSRHSQKSWYARAQILRSMNVVHGSSGCSDHQEPDRSLHGDQGVVE